MQKIYFFVDLSNADSYKMHTFIQDCFFTKKKSPPEKRGPGNLAPRARRAARRCISVLGESCSFQWIAEKNPRSYGTV